MKGNPLSYRILRDGELPEVLGRQITPSMVAEMPDNCFVIPLEILDPPEPISQSALRDD